MSIEQFVKTYTFDIESSYTDTKGNCNTTYSLAPLPVPASITMQDLARAKRSLEIADRAEKATKKCCNQEGNTMRSNNEIKNYFADRAESIFYDLDKGLQKQFGLKDDATPRTAADFVARIQAGKFVLPRKEFDYGSQSITWRDPSVVRDSDGYATAYAALKVQRTKTVDQIMSDETKAMDAVDAFETWTFTAPVATTTATA